MDLDLHTQDMDRLLYMLNMEIRQLIDRELGLAQLRRRFLSEPFHHWKDVWRFKPPEIEDSGSSASAADSDDLNGRFNETRDSADADDQGYHGWLEAMRYMGSLEEMDEVGGSSTDQGYEGWLQEMRVQRWIDGNSDG